MSYSEPGYAPMAMASTLHRNHRKTTHLRENHLLVLEKYPTTYNTRNSLHYECLQRSSPRPDALSYLYHNT